MRWLALVLVCVCCGGRALRNDSGASAGAGGTGPLPASDCIVGIRIDECCDLPVVVRSSDLATDPCVVPWSHRRSVSTEVRAKCKALALGCENVKCTTPPVPSRVAAPAADGSCAFSDECVSNLDCDLAQDASQFCDCPMAYPSSVIEAEGCLFSQLNHTVEDCLTPLCGATTPCDPCLCPGPSEGPLCGAGEMGLRVCGPPFDGFRSL